MKTKLVLLNIAEQDLKAAKYLFKENLYPQAIFYLQQAVEKSTKAMGLHHNIITEDELEDVGHESVKIYIKILEGLRDKMRRFQDRIKQFPKLKHTTLFKEFDKIGPDKFDDILNNFESFLKRPDRQLSDDKLEKALMELTELEVEISSQKITIGKDDIENFKSLFHEVANAISEESPAAREIVEEELKKFDSLTPELVSGLIESLGISQAICNNHLLFLSMILCPHAISSRYPYPKRGHNPMETYVDEHPLVKKFDQLALITERVLYIMHKLYSKNFSESWGNQPIGR